MLYCKDPVHFKKKKKNCKDLVFFFLMGKDLVFDLAEGWFWDLD